jgi:DNA-binding MarR family transcriptional regulator
MAIVNRLQSRGYVERSQSKTDGRRQTLHITAAGHEALHKAWDANRVHEEWLKSKFTSEEVAVLIDFLRRIHD